MFVQLCDSPIFFGIELLGPWQGCLGSAMDVPQGAKVEGGPGGAQLREKLKFASVASSQSSSQDQDQQLARLLEAQETTTAALVRRREAWAAAKAAPTEPQQVRYRRCRGGVSAHHAMMAGAAGEGAHWDQDPSAAKQIWCKSRVLPRCLQICKWQVAGKQ